MLRLICQSNTGHHEGLYKYDDESVFAGLLYDSELPYLNHVAALKMPEQEVAQHAQQGSEAPDWSGGEEQFGGQRVDSSGEDTPSADSQGSRSQNSDAYVGFTQQDSGLKRLGGSHLQNQFRQASVAPRSAQSSSLNTQTGYNQGLSRSGYTQALSQPAQSSYPSVRSVQSSLVSKPNRRMSSTLFNAPKVPVNNFALSTSIASGSSVSKFSTKKQNNAAISKSSTLPVQQGTQRTSKYPSSSSASVGNPSRESYTLSSASHQSAAPPPARPSYFRQSSATLNQKQAPRSISPKSSIPRAPALHHNSVPMQTSATAAGRKVSLKASKKPSRFSYHHNERSRHNPTKSEAGKPHRSKMFAVTGSEGNYMASSYNRSLPAWPYRPNSGFQQPRSRKVTTSSGAGTSGQQYAPTKIHSIPQRYGGYAIRRLKGPDQNAVSVWKPQLQRPSLAAPPPQRPAPPPQRPSTVAPPPQRPAPPPQRPSLAAPPPRRPSTVAPPPQRPYTAPPQQPASYKPQAQSVHPESKWKRIKPQRLTSE
ncbi:hypothetical protein PAMA_011268 [Pampus argenteus]